MQRLADGAQTDVDRQFMLVMALALAGRAAVDIIDEGRLQTWLAAHAERQGPARYLSDEASGGAAHHMVLWRQCCTCQQPEVSRRAAGGGAAHAGLSQVHEV